MFQQLRRHFFLGVFTITPFAITLYVIILLGAWFDALFQPVVQFVTKNFDIQRLDFLLFAIDLEDGRIPGLGILVGISVIVIVGVAAPSFVGKYFLTVTEKIVEKIPLAKVIYSAARQIFDAFSQTSPENFKRVVMVPFPMEGSYAIGFVTKEAPEGWVPGQEDTKLAVFVPTSPNPTSGYLMFVRESSAIPLDVTVEEGLKLVISAALARPEALVKKAQ